MVVAGGEDLDALRRRRSAGARGGRRNRGGPGGMPGSDGARVTIKNAETEAADLAGAIADRGRQLDDRHHAQRVGLHRPPHDDL